MTNFNHINNVWNYLDQFHSINDLEIAFGNIPSKYGSFEIVNKDTYKEDGYFEICNSYWSNQYNDYQYDYHCIKILY